VPTGSRDAAAAYYRTLTSLYRWYGTSAHGWHYGIYDRGIDGHAASLTRSNELLLEGLNGTRTTLLDVGCGEGGFSVWAAARGYTVTGCTLSIEHAKLAQTLAQSNGVEERCRFLIGDLDSMPFGPASFDVVVNQETWCHSQSKAAYVQSVRRLLLPGGQFRCVDLALGDQIQSASGVRQYRAVREGFQVPSLISKRDALDHLTAAGFCDISVVDMTAHVKRSALLILAFSVGPSVLSTLGLGRWLYGTDERIAGLYRRHVEACLAFNRGLWSGVFRYLYVTARKPLA
jgi:cyclopropane fatty-acyl-phospholipid synthase-like methyltransferase